MTQRRTRIKICGITRAEDALTAVACGVDAIGIILHADSPRLISIQQAQAIRQVVPAFVTLVGVFVNCSANKINEYSEQIGLDLVQLHGDESNEFACVLHRPYIKAIRVKSNVQMNSDVKQYPDARAILIEPYIEGMQGGTGQSLNFDLWPTNVSQPLILAGGLGPENITQSVAALKPFAVDLSSGLETKPGIKDPVLIEQVISALM